MGKFLLNRPDDRDTQSKGRIIVNMLIWLVILYAGYLVLYVICMGIYGANGVIPTKLTEYGTDPYYWKEQPFWQTILWVLILAPLCEESMFRLGLSFKRRTVGLWAGLLPVVVAWYVFHCRVWFILLLLAFAGGLIFWLICRYTTDEQWENWRKNYIIPAMWVSAIGFGLFHLNAFSVLNWMVLPFALVKVLQPMADGCAFTYARVNLGFWWGVLFHFTKNLPGVLLIASDLILRAI